MPVRYSIFPARELVLVQYEGFATHGESLATIDAYARDADFRPDQKFFFDLSRVTGHEQDFIRFFQVQGQLAEVFGQTGHDQLLGIHAPNPAAKAMAKFGYQSWEGVRHIVMMVHDDEAEVLHFLGQPERSLAGLMAATGPQG